MNSWSAFPLTPLSYLADVRPSGVDKLTNHDEIPVRLCNYTDIYYRERIKNDITFMEASATTAEVERFQLAQGDVVMTKDSETAHDIGIPALVAEKLDGVLLGYHNTLMRPSAKLEPGFLFWFLSSRVAAAYWATKARGVTRVGLRTDDVAALLVPVPPLDTQRRIADMLDTETARIDTLIEKNHHLIAGLQRRFSSQLEQSLTAWAVGDITVPRSVQATAERAPAGWHATRLEAITTAVQDRVSLAEMADAGDVVHFTIEELGNTGRPRTDSGSDIGSDKLRVRGDELLISRLNPRKGHVFEVTPHEGLTVASGEFAIMRPRDGITTRRFLFYYLTTPLIRASLDAGVQSATKSQQRVSFDRIWQTAIALPPLSEQHRLAALLDESRSRIDGLCLRIDQQTALLRLRRQALITAAVTGQIEV